MVPDGLINDGRNVFRYDGSNRLKDVYTVAYSGGNRPTRRVRRVERRFLQ